MGRPASDRLAHAEEHCFFLSCEDSGTALCRANVRFGIAKIHWVQEALGLPPDATFIGAPDATVTRNAGRWRQGFGYGGRVDWTGELAVLDIKPNACGMLVASLDERPEPRDVQARIEALRTAPLEVDGIRLEYDLANGNHFLDLFAVDGSQAAGRARDPFGPWLFILHGSGREMRVTTDRGPGMYWDESAELRALAELHDTPWGEMRILRGERARAWWRFMEWVDGFHGRRRVAQADWLFGAGRWRKVTNGTHQGLRGPTTALLGALVFETGADEVHPLTLRPDLPAYLLRGRPNVREDVLERLGIAERASRLGVLGRLRGANLLPHGGGYTYPRFRAEVETIGGLRDAERRFRLLPVDPGDAPKVVATPRELVPEFRGGEVLARVRELDLAEVAATLSPFYVARP